MMFWTIFTGEKRRGNGGQDETDYLITVGFVQGGEETPWKAANTASFEETFTEENGYRLISTDSGNDQEKQIDALHQMIVEKVDYILLAPVVETGWEHVLSEAEEARIPVILVHNQIDEWETDSYECWIGSDYRNQMKKAGKWLEKYLEENPREEEDEDAQKLYGTTDDAGSEEAKSADASEAANAAKGSEAADSSGSSDASGTGTDSDVGNASGAADDSAKDSAKDKSVEQEPGLAFVVLQGDIGSVEQMARAESWMLVMEQHSDWDIKGQQTGENSQETAKEVMKLFLEQEPELDVVIAEDDAMALGAIEAIQEAGKSCGADGDIIIISFGGTKEGLQAVADGSLNVTFEESPVLAPKAAEAIQRMEAGIAVDREQHVKEKYFDLTMNLEKLIEKRAY